jgi:hypothetical protein
MWRLGHSYVGSTTILPDTKRFGWKLVVTQFLMRYAFKKSFRTINLMASEICSLQLCQFRILEWACLGSHQVYGSETFFECISSETVSPPTFIIICNCFTFCIYVVICISLKKSKMILTGSHRGIAIKVTVYSCLFMSCIISYYFCFIKLITSLLWKHD